MKTKFSLPGMIIGTTSFVVAVLHLWLGPIEKVSIEDIAVQKARKIKQAMINLVTDNDAKVDKEIEMGPDKIVNAAVMITALAGMVLGLIGFVRKENIRYASTSIAISGVTIALQYVVAAVGAIVVALLIIAVLSKLDLS